MADSPAVEKKHWWRRNTKVVEKLVRDARVLMATREQSSLTAAIDLLDAALVVSPHLEVALELKARSLLLLRRFRDVADMLRGQIPSLASSVRLLSAEKISSSRRVRLLPSRNPGVVLPETGEHSVKCWFASGLRRRVMAAGVWKNGEKDDPWRCSVLGQACYHLGLVEDALDLLQTGKRLAGAALRRRSVRWSEDLFSFSDSGSGSEPHLSGDPEIASRLLGHIKLLLRRRTTALSALDAGLYPEAIRHFSKIVDGRHTAPQGFLAETYSHRASAYLAAGRVAESIADWNRTLALDPTSMQALAARASLLETIRSLHDALHDLEHLKLLYTSALRDGKLPGPPWKRHAVTYEEIPGRLCEVAAKIQELKQRVCGGGAGSVDYYALMGLRRGCTRTELERAHALLCLRHDPERGAAFVDRCELADDRDGDSVRDRAKMSALLLCRLIRKGYSSVMGEVMEEEAAARQEEKTAAAAAMEARRIRESETEKSRTPELKPEPTFPKPNPIVPPSELEPLKATAAQFRGVFCRDIAAVGNLLTQAGFNRPWPVKYEALSC